MKRLRELTSQTLRTWIIRLKRTNTPWSAIGVRLADWLGLDQPVPELARAARQRSQGS